MVATNVVWGWRFLACGGVTVAMVGLSVAEAYSKYADELVGFAAATVGPFDAEDVVAAAVTRVMASSAWESVVNHRAYLYRAVMNEALNLKRATRRRLKRELLVAPRESSDGPLTDRDVLDALHRLTVRQRAVVYLTYWVDLPIGEVGVVLGIAARSVQRDLTVARRRIKELLG
jgi:RNA polymerase sigma factor (sigma-70 family)